MSEFSGKTIKGYEFRKRIGMGGFGAVYHAYQPILKREVAIKVIRPDQANNADFIRRFEIEAELVARLEHPHIVPVFDFWRDADGAFIVMRFLRGGSLSDRIAHGPLDLEDIARMLDQIAGGLSAAHKQGVIHRDIKPDNILVDESGNAYLTDFGIAKSPDMDAISRDDAVHGSIHYIAPEQLRSMQLGPETDVYSLGITIYELITGIHPFSPTDNISDLIYKHLEEMPPPLADMVTDLPSALDEVIRKATAKDRQDRYADPIDMALAFRAAITKPDSNPVAAITPAPSYDLDMDFEMGDTASLVNPFKGLRAFREGDSDDFFGRESLVETLIERVNTEGVVGRFMAVVGPSGSGKSSVVRAGLLPALRRGDVPGSQDWFILEMMPGAHPFAELEAALLRIAVNPPPSLMEQLVEANGLLRTVKRVLPGDDDSELVLFIDQFEELFTMVDDEEARAHFLDSLLAAVNDPRSRLRVIVTLRADFYDRPLQYRAFGELLDANRITVYPLSPDELAQAIERPAEQSGVFLEPGLTQRIIADVAQQPGALPLLQYALTELFERRDGRMMSNDAYATIGGVTGALAQRAGEIFMAMSGEDQAIARQLFLRLVTPGEGTEDTRRRARLSELLGVGDGMQDVIDEFGRARLLTFDNDPITREPTLEVAHEALIRTWGQMRDWLNESRDNLRLQRRLNIAAGEWAESGNDTSFLAQDARLDQFAALLDAPDVMLNITERDYIQASIAEREAQAEQERQRQAYEARLERRALNRLRYLAAGLTVFLVVAGILTVIALGESQNAQTERDNAQTQAFIARSNADAAATSAAEAQAAAAAEADALATAVSERDRADLQSQIAVSQRVAAQALREVDNRPDLALLLSLEAFQRNDNFDTRSTLLMAATSRPVESIYLRDSRTPITATALSRDGQWLAASDEENNVFIWNLKTGERANNAFFTPSQPPKDMIFLPDNKTLLTVDIYGDIVEWSVPTGEVRRVLPLGLSANSVVARFSPDGSLVATVNATASRLTLYNTTTGEIVGSPIASQAFFPLEFNFSRDGSLLAVLDLGPAPTITGEVFDVTTGESIITLPLPDGEDTGPVFQDPIFNRDGTQLIVSYIGSTHIWDLTTGESIVISGDQNPIDYGTTPTAYTPGDFDIYLQLSSFEIIRADAETGEVDLSLRLPGHRSRAEHMLITPDGDRLVTVDADGLIMIWLLDGTTTLAEYTVTDYIFGSNLFINRMEAVTADETALIVRDLRSGDAIVTIPDAHDAGITAITMTSDGRILVSADETGLIRVWDRESGERLVEFTEHTDRTRLLEISPDNRFLMSSSDNGLIVIWDLETLEKHVVLTIPGTTPSAATSSFAATFSPDGRYLALATLDNQLQFWALPDFKPVQSSSYPGVANAIAFSPDGSLLALPDDSNAIRLWDVETLQQVGRPLIGHDQLVREITFSADGSMLASADRSIRLWDVERQEAIGGPLRYNNEDFQFFNSYDLGFSADGDTLYALYANGGITWDLALTDTVDTLCRQANRNYDPADWAREFFGEAYRPTCPSSSDALIPYVQTGRDRVLNDEDALAIFQQATDWAVQTHEDLPLVAVCQYGAFYGYIETVMPACDHLVTNGSGPWHWRLTRAFARAIAEDIDGAAEDMTAALAYRVDFESWLLDLNYTLPPDFTSERREWLAALEAGENPLMSEDFIMERRELLETLLAPPAEDD